MQRNHNYQSSKELNLCNLLSFIPLQVPEAGLEPALAF